MLHMLQKKINKRPHRIAIATKDPKDRGEFVIVTDVGLQAMRQKF
jgi:hypothetical protein